jgi:pimeloyl-ACP methyl ester carboxylesterase
MLVTLALATLALSGSGSQVTQSAVPTTHEPAPKVEPSKAPNAVSVTIPTTDKLLIAGRYWAPKCKDKAPGALLLHTAGADRRSLDELGEYLFKKGFAVLAVDVRGHGGSVVEGTDWSKAADDKARESMWGLAARDVDAAAAYLLQRTEVHSTNLSVFGVGAGCALALRHAKSDDNTRALVLITPEAESYGYNTAQGVTALAGMPTLIVASNKAKDVAERLKAVGHEANAGIEYIELSLVRAEPAEVLADSKLNNSAATWLRTQVMAKK